VTVSHTVAEVNCKKGAKVDILYFSVTHCPDFGWDRVNFLPNSCSVLDLEQEER